MSDPKSLVIPVYLKQRIVFDLVAMLQGGISTVTRVSEIRQAQSSTERDVGAGFGLTNAFASLLKIDLSAARRQTSGDESGRSSQEERVHTPASLFFALRELLVERGQLKSDASGPPKPGDFLEFSTTLTRNPVIEVMDALHQMMSMAILLVEPEPQIDVKHSKNAKHKKGERDDPRLNQLTQIDQFRDMLRTGETIDLTSGVLENGHRAVVTLEGQYLNDPSMGDLVDGTFTVTGKVIRVLSTGDRGVSLIRKTALGRLPGLALDQAFEGLNLLSASQGFALPRVEWEIRAPVLQILPVAIYT